MNQKSNYQDILKIIAIIAMVIDHIGTFFFPEELYLRSIGRYSFPVFCFFAGFNFKGKLNYNILSYGAVFYIFTSFIIFQEFFEANILISIFCGQIYLKIFRKHLENFYLGYLHVFILAGLWSLSHMIIEYGTVSIAIMVLGQIAKQKPEQLYLPSFIASYLSFLHIKAVFDQLFQLQEILYSLIVMLILFFLLNYKKLQTSTDLRLGFIRKNLLNIYCFHLAIILVIWRYNINLNKFNLFG